MVDIHCVQRAQNGDEISWQKIVKAYENSILNLLARFSQDRWEIDDIYQEVWLRAYRKIHLYNSEYPFRTWLMKVAANVALNYRRKKWRRFFTWEQEPYKVEGMNYCEFVDEINKPLSTLAPKARIIFLLYHYESYTTKEIAFLLEIPEGTVKSHLSRSAKSLQRLFCRENKR